jgi:hypothetical protein
VKNAGSAAPDFLIRAANLPTAAYEFESNASAFA